MGKWTERLVWAGLVIALTLCVGLAYRKGEADTKQSSPLHEEMNRNAYLHKLAKAVENWYDSRPPTAAVLAKKLACLRVTCTVLLYEEHKPLTVEDRRWLRERILLLAEQCQTALCDLEEGKRNGNETWELAVGLTYSFVNAVRSRAYIIH